MEDLKYELTETGGRIAIPMEAVLANDVERVREHIQEQFRAAAEEVGRSKATLSQNYDVKSESYIVEWVWVDTKD